MAQIELHLSAYASKKAKAALTKADLSWDRCDGFNAAGDEWIQIYCEALSEVRLALEILEEIYPNL